MIARALTVQVWVSLAFHVYAATPAVPMRQASSRMLQLHTHNPTQQSLEKQLMGTTPAQIANKLNAFVRGHVSVRQVRPCSSLELNDVAVLREALIPLVDHRQSMEWPAEDGRQLALPLTAGEPQVEHVHAINSVGSQKVLRDALCAETLKLWAHHLSESIKAVPRNLTLPSIPVFNDTDWMDKAGRLYNKSFTCVNGHSVPAARTSESPESWAGWPQWPLRGHFVSKGHGPFPFWHFGRGAFDFPNAMPLNVSVSRPYLYNPGNFMEVWYDMAVNTTKFYHSNCDWILVDVMGFEGQPCIHLMTKDNLAGKWYLMTADRETKRANGEYCCEDSFSSIGTMNPRFMDGMYYAGEVDFKGDYYTGRAKRYQTRLKSFARVIEDDALPEDTVPEALTHPTLPVDIWYETDLEGRPLRFAEAGISDDDDMQSIFKVGGYLTSSDFPLLYTEYNSSSWEHAEGTVPAAELDLPAACFDPIPQCGVPGSVITPKEFAQYPKRESWPTCVFYIESSLPFAGETALSSHSICDLYDGRLMHNGSAHIWKFRPAVGCHTYVVVNTSLTGDVGVRNPACASLRADDILASIAVDAATCHNMGERCLDE